MKTGARRENGAPDRRRLWLRRICIAIAGFETAVLAGYAGLMAAFALSSDPWGIARGVAILAAIPLTGFSLPALALAIHGRWLWTALTLAMLGLLVSILLWRGA
jgi:hypothetical protein